MQNNQHLARMFSTSLTSRMRGPTKVKAAEMILLALCLLTLVNPSAALDHLTVSPCSGSHDTRVRQFPLTLLYRVPLAEQVPMVILGKKFPPALITSPAFWSPYGHPPESENLPSTLLHGVP